jgi:ribosome assembly protein YihI (activator of Der GTPase)
LENIFSNLLTIQSKTMTDKMKKLINSKTDFQEEFQILERVNIINQILEFKSARNDKEAFLSLEQGQENDPALKEIGNLLEEMPFPRANSVIGPRISEKICAIKSLDAEE